jgi:Fur family ferric uptake transcriptional regulator
MEKKRPSNYNTEQRTLILGYMEALGAGHATAGQIALHFRDAGAAVSRATVYRHLERLVNEGRLRKFVLGESDAACYQSAAAAEADGAPYHLKCEVCGDLLHLECALLADIQRHLLVEHNFQINNRKTVFYGRCAKCL